MTVTTTNSDRAEILCRAALNDLNYWIGALNPLVASGLHPTAEATKTLYDGLCTIRAKLNAAGV